MNDLFFWKKWTPQTRLLYLVSLGLFILSNVYFVYSYFTGIESGFSWETELSIENKTGQIDVFKSKLFEIPVMAENFVVLQSFKPVFTDYTLLSSYFFLFLTFFGACLGLAVITTYKKLLWFIPGTALLAAWLASFKMDLLGVYGYESNVTVGVMLFVYLGMAYLFHSIIKRVSFLKRFLSFFLVTVIFGLAIHFGSSHAQPFVHLANYGLIIPGLITLIFLMIIGYEILQLGLSTITFSKSSNPWSIPLNFLVITILYIGNLIIYFLYTEGQIEWKVAYNVYLFFPICAILGIWSHRKRSVLYTDILPFAPGGAFLYLSFALISTVTIGYVLSLSLTPAIKLFEYAFMTTQISFGLAFFVYAVRNFYKPMVHNMPVFKMIYDPRMLPHYIMRGLALVFMAYFVGRNLYGIKDKALSSYHSLIADSFSSNSELNLATYNYGKAMDRSSSIHAGYRQALLFLENNNTQAGWDVLNKIKDEDKTIFTYGLLSSSLKDNSRELLTHFVLGDAVKKFPENPYLSNNRALSFYKLGSLDSAVHYLNKNTNNLLGAELESNVLAIATLAELTDLEEIELNTAYNNNLAYQANAYALANANNTTVKNPELMKLDTLLGGLELSYLNNFVNANVGEVPVEVINTLRNYLKATEDRYDPNKNNARIALSKALFFNGQVNEGLKLAERVTNLAPDVQVPYYANFTGLLALRIGDYKNGKKYTGRANEMLQLVPENFARLNYGISSLEVGDTANASNTFIALSYLKPENREQYSAIYESLAGDFSSSDLHRASYLVYHPDAFKGNYFNVLEEITNLDLKLVAATHLLEKALDKNDLGAVEKLWSYIPTGINDDFFYKKLNLLNLRSTQKAKNFKSLNTSLSELEIDKLDERWKVFLAAQVSHYTTSDTSKTNLLYKESVLNFPDREEVWLEYISFLKLQGKDNKSYDLTADYLIANGYTEQMLKAHVDLAVTIGLIGVAEEVVPELEKLMDKDGFLEFKDKFDARVEALNEF